ncbi:MAG: radical SAM protein [Myxococcota bacterium]
MLDFDEFQRANLLAKPRPRALKLAPTAPPGARRLPLAPTARDIDRAFRPVYAVWEITLRCDLACRHCGSRAGHARPDELTTAECLELADQMADLGVLEVTLIGGEAYLRDDWVEIAAHLVERGLAVTMTTGGRGITPPRAAAAKAVGLSAVSVSIDGIGATHDRLRGVDGSFAAALGAMDILRAAGVRVTCNTQINRLSVQLETFPPPACTEVHQRSQTRVREEHRLGVEARHLVAEPQDPQAPGA